MANFWGLVNSIIRKSDVLCLVLDARLVEDTRNPEIEDKARSLGRPLIYILNKCDLVSREEARLRCKDLNPCVRFSAKERWGKKILRERIMIEGKRAGITDTKIKVGILGYPNVGKSSVINSLVNKSVAKSSICSGLTTGVKRIRFDNNIMLFDTPGVIPYKEKDPSKHALIGTVDFTKVREPDLVVMDLLENFPGKTESYYGVDANEDPEETIHSIAVKRNILKSGGKPDMMRMARMILKDWQKGLIR